MADRTITIDIKANYEDVLKAQQYVKQMQSQQVEIKCVATIDGKLTAMNFEQAMAKLQNGTINKFNLVLDTADLQKSLKQAQSLVSKSADEIAQEFEKATKSRTTETLKKNYLGKKSFSGNSDKALKEYAQYLAKAQEQVNKTSLDLSNISGGADPDQIYAYTKALKEYLIILNDIEGSASQKGLAVNIDFDSELSKIEDSLREVGEKSTTMIQNWAKSAAESIPSVLENVKKTYIDIASSLKQVNSAGENTVSTEQFEALVAELEKAKSALESLRQSYRELADGAAAERDYAQSKFEENLELSAKFKESQKEVEDLGNRVDELNSKLAETGKSGNTFLSEEQIEATVSALKDLADAVNIIKDSIGTLDDGTDMTPLLSQIKEIQTAMASLSETFKEFKGLNINFDLGSLGKTGDDAVTRAVKRGQASRKSLEEYIAAYTELEKAVGGMSTIFQGNTSSLASKYMAAASGISGGKYDQLASYKSMIAILKEAASMKGIDISSWSSQFEANLNSVDEALNKTVNAGTKLETFKTNLSSIFGGNNTINIENISTQVSEVVAKIEELQKTLQAGLSFKDLVGTDISSEASGLESVYQAVKRVTDKVNDKTDAFDKEASAVSAAINSELGDLVVLEGAIEEVSKMISDMYTDISSKSNSSGSQMFKGIKEGLDSLRDLGVDGVDEKIKSLIGIVNAFSGTTPNTKNIKQLAKAIESLKDIDLTKFSELKNADIEGADAKAQTLVSTLNALGTVTTNTKSIKSLGEGLKSLSDVDFSKLSGLGNLDFGNLMMLSNIQFRKNAFDGLIDAMQKLSNPQNMNMDVLDRLSKIDFQGLQGLNYIKKAADANVTLSNGFVGMQQSRINSTLAKARKAGVTEDKLAPLVDAGTKLRETFNPANIGNLNIADEMQNWVAAFDPVIDAVEQATAKQNELVAAFNREGNTTDNVQKAQDDALSSFKKVISERSSLISKMTTTSGWTNQDQERMKQLTTQMLDYQKMYKDNPEFQDLINQGKASEKDIANNYSSILNSVQNQIDTIQAKYAQKNLNDNPYYQSLLNQFEAFKQLKEKFEANNFFNPEDAYNVMQLRGGIGSTDQQFSREVKNLDKVSDIFDSLNKKYSGKNSSDYVNADVFDQIKSKMQEIQAISQQGVINEADVEKAKSLKEEISDLESKLTSKVNKKGTFLGTITGAGSSDGIRQMKELIKAQEEAKGNKVNFGAITNNGLGLNFDVVTASGQLQKYKASVDEASGAVRIFMKSESEYVSTGQKFVNSLKGKFAELTRYFTVMDVFQKAMSFVKEGVSSVVEINTAMTELKKVTDETSDSYANFQKQAGSIASELGSTTSDVITATGDYARLGHTMEESAELAKSSVVLKNVSEYESVSEATEALTAMTQAYQNLDSMEITDKLNNIGNNFSISTEDLATGLQKSASVLSLMGNSIDEAAALITAGNSTLQDVNSVAAGIRTISLRIVGTEEAKQELESLGEDTTDYIVQTAAKQRATIMNYTAVASNGGRGVDILDANGNYKNTYEIFKEISGVYKEIQEEDKKFGTNRAQALVEVLAGEHFCLKNVVTHFYRTHLIALVA